MCSQLFILVWFHKEYFVLNLKAFKCFLTTGIKLIWFGLVATASDYWYATSISSDTGCSTPPVIILDAASCIRLTCSITSQQGDDWDTYCKDSHSKLHGSFLHFRLVDIGKYFWQLMLFVPKATPFIPKIFGRQHRQHENTQKLNRKMLIQCKFLAIVKCNISNTCMAGDKTFAKENVSKLIKIKYFNNMTLMEKLDWKYPNCLFYFVLVFWIIHRLIMIIQIIILKLSTLFMV